MGSSPLNMYCALVFTPAVVLCKRLVFGYGVSCTQSFKLLFIISHQKVDFALRFDLRDPPTGI
jgi:hypothetical protein